jgi:hypothetical protein
VPVDRNPTFSLGNPELSAVRPKKTQPAGWVFSFPRSESFICNLFVSPWFPVFPSTFHRVGHRRRSCKE